MKEELTQRIGAVLNALNHISVSGKANLTNLSGSIAVLEEIASMLQGADVVPTAEEDKGRT